LKGEVEMNTRWLGIAAATVLAAISLTTVASNVPLTFEQRLAAQEAIERVYYSHRIWPKENPAPKPPFEQLMTRSMLDAKVSTYLKESAALEKFWRRPITSEQLQAEMERMAKDTKRPAMLRELFAALNDDPYVIAECLARPILANRLLHGLFSSDARFDADARNQAGRALQGADPEDLERWPEGQYRAVTFRLRGAQSPTAYEPPDPREILLDGEAFQKLEAQAANPEKLVLRETATAFSVRRSVRLSDGAVRVESLLFPKRTFGSWWKEVSPGLAFDGPSAGASAFAVPQITASASPAPEAAADSWVATNSTDTDCPSTRVGHTAVWTGTEMIVWGGQVLVDPWVTNSLGLVDGDLDRLALPECALSAHRRVDGNHDDRVGWAKRLRHLPARRRNLQSFRRLVDGDLDRLALPGCTL
jgi:hypothetical protein